MNGERWTPACRAGQVAECRRQFPGKALSGNPQAQQVAGNREVVILVASLPLGPYRAAQQRIEKRNLVFCFVSAHGLERARAPSWLSVLAWY